MDSIQVPHLNGRKPQFPVLGKAKAISIRRTTKGARVHDLGRESSETRRVKVITFERPPGVLFSHHSLLEYLVSGLASSLLKHQPHLPI